MIKKILLIVSLLSTFSVQAEENKLIQISKTLQSLYPVTSFTEVKTTPVPGLYEVIMGKNVAYTDKSGRYFMFGHLLDMANQHNLTAEVLEILNKVDVATLPIEDSIKTVKGNGKRKLYLFSDPDCPYCKRLEQELQKLDNVTIYTFLYPIAELHPQAAEKARKVWCSSDQNAAWNALMLEEKISNKADESCQNPVDRNIALGQRMGIEGTPTMILENGKLAQGYMEIVELEKLLEGAKQ